MRCNEMAASYKKLFKLLIDRDMKKKELAEKAGISIATITKMGKSGAVVSSDILVKICIALECTMNDIMEIVSDKKEAYNICETDIWDSSIPVEKSSYLCDDEIFYYNLDNFLHDKNKLTMIDLFCGAGGFAVGCSWAGFESVLGIDHFEPAMRTWSYNHPHAIGCLGDITKIDPKKIKELLHSK